jgi:hypothetical protein
VAREPKFIERIHLAPGGFRSEHIDEVELRHSDTGIVERLDVGIAARLIDDYGWDIRVLVPAAPRTKPPGQVTTIHPYGRPAYLRSTAGGYPTDDLLQLPTY